MKVICDGMRVTGKNKREGENERGPWVIYEVECANGEGKHATLSTSEEVYGEVVAFEEVTGEIDVYDKGYNLKGELLAIYK